MNNLSKLISSPPEIRVKNCIEKYFSTSSDQVHIKRLPGDASVRIYFRLTAQNESQIAAVLPNSFDIKLNPYIVLTNFFKDCKKSVPSLKSLYEDLGIMMIEDLGDIRLQDLLHSIPPDQIEKVYQEAIDIIIDIQKTTETAIKRNLKATQLVFDEEILLKELSFFYENYFINFLNSPLETTQEKNLFQEFESLVKELSKVERVLCHRDYHSRNLMWHQEKLYMIDYQDARMGPATYDIASLLEDPYVTIDSSIRDRLKHYFIDQHFKIFSNKYYSSLQSFESEYNLMVVQRMLKAVGTFSHQASVKQNISYVEYILPALTVVATALKQLEQLPVTQQIIYKTQVDNLTRV